MTQTVIFLTLGDIRLTNGVPVGDREKVLDNEGLNQWGLTCRHHFERHHQVMMG